FKVTQAVQAVPALRYGRSGLLRTDGLLEALSSSRAALAAVQGLKFIVTRYRSSSSKRLIADAPFKRDRLAAGFKVQSSKFKVKPARFKPHRPRGEATGQSPWFKVPEPGPKLIWVQSSGFEPVSGGASMLR